MSRRVGLRCIPSIAGRVKKVLHPSAWNYDNLVGAIWLQGVGHSGYDNAPTGQIEVREPTGLDALGQYQGGSYDNRA